MMYATKLISCSFASVRVDAVPEIIWTWVSWRQYLLAWRTLNSLWPGRERLQFPSLQVFSLCVSYRERELRCLCADKPGNHTHAV